MLPLTTSNKPMILVVEDDVDVLDATAHGLTARGFEVLTATNGAAAIDICHEYQARIEAVVADLSLPGDHGGAARRIAAGFPHLKMVYASGIPRHVALSTGLVQPEAPYLEKPVDPDLLARVLRGSIATLAPDRDPWPKAGRGPLGERPRKNS
jgi:CheY-like chemotaxis protein